MKKIIFCGGGTAGHVMPNLALIEKLSNSYEIYYIGSENGIEKKLVSNYHFVKYFSVETTKLKRKICIDNLFIPFKLIKGIHQSKKLLKEIQPNIIFSKGGYVSVPICIAAKQLCIPVISHESDLSMGLANKIISKTSVATCCSFRKTTSEVKNGVYTGTPFRKCLFNGNKQKFMSENNLNTQLPTLLVIGGSLGAKALNNIVYDIVTDLTKKMNVIHIVGKGNSFPVRNINNYLQLEFTDNMGDVYASTDFVLSRAGSNAINEMLVLLKPMLLVPLPKTESRGDQIENAYYFKDYGYAEVLEQENLTQDKLKTEILNLLKNKQKYIDNMVRNENIDSCRIICDLIEKYEKK